jgi:hypothetical protein
LPTDSVLKFHVIVEQAANILLYHIDRLFFQNDGYTAEKKIPNSCFIRNRQVRGTFLFVLSNNGSRTFTKNYMKQRRLKIRQSLRGHLIASDYCYRVSQSCPLPGRSHLRVSVLLTVPLGIILVNNQFDALFQCTYLFHFSTSFEQPSAPHQENQLYQYIIWYVSLFVGDGLVCRSYRHTIKYDYRKHNKKEVTENMGQSILFIYCSYIVKLFYFPL